MENNFQKPIDEYLAGVKAAGSPAYKRRPGRIVYCKPEYSPFGPSDKFSLYPKPNLPGDSGDVFGIEWGGKFHRSNTRPLAPIMRDLIPHFAGENIDWLELGMGAGVATYEAYRVAQEARKNLKAVGVSLTPINPHLGFRFYASVEAVEEIKARKDELVDRPDLLAQVEEIQESIRFGLLLELAEVLELDLYDDLGEESFLDTQFVGKFPEDFYGFKPFEKKGWTGLRDRKFDVIYDSHGAFQYVDGQPDFMRYVYSRLNDSGILVVKPARFAEGFEDYVGNSVRQDGDIVFHSSFVKKDFSNKNDHPNDFTILAKKKSVLAKKARENGVDYYVTRNDLAEFIPQLLAA